MGLFIAIVALVALGYFVGLYFTISNKRINIWLKSIILVALSIVSFFFFSRCYRYYYNNPEMISVKSYFGLAPKFSDSINIKNGDYTITYTRKTDYNTGAMGGLKISNSLVLINKGKQKELEIYFTDKKYKPYMVSIHPIEFENEHEIIKHRIYIFVNPSVFSVSEYNIIGQMLLYNFENIEHIVNHSYSFMTRPKKYRLLSIYYQSRGALKRIFKCKNGITIKITENGGVFAFSSNKKSIFFCNATNPESIFARKNKIGNVINNGSEITLSSSLASANFITTQNKQKLFYSQKCTIESCFDKNGNNLFDSYIFSKQALSKKISEK